MVQKIVAQLMCLDSTDDDSEDDETDDLDIRKSNLVFQTLTAWYTNQYPATIKRSARERPPLIIVLEDFESFSASLLRDFILNLA